MRAPERGVGSEKRTFTRGAVTQMPRAQPELRTERQVRCCGWGVGWAWEGLWAPEALRRGEAPPLCSTRVPEVAVTTGLSGGLESAREGGRAGRGASMPPPAPLHPQASQPLTPQS